MILALRLSQWGFTLFFGMILFINSCVSFHTENQKVERYFGKREVPVRINFLDFQGKTTRYIETGLDHKRTLIVFVHGAPGSSNNFFSYLADSALLRRARLVAIDRLGYGESDPGHAETSIAVQAEQVRKVVEQYQADSVILVGHSYGGPIVGKCAMDFPELLTAVVMLAPVNDPDNEPIFWYSHFGRWKATRWLLPAALKVAADEKFSHAKALAAIADGWKKISIPVIHIHGKKDGLAPPEANVAFSKENIPPQYLKLIYLENTGHLIPWTDYDIVKQILLDLLENKSSD